MNFLKLFRLRFFAHCGQGGKGGQKEKNLERRESKRKGKQRKVVCLKIGGEGRGKIFLVLMTHSLFNS